MSKTEVKKKYWKLSLLIHPDKCEHPKAQAAFAAVNEAAKTLQDEAGRRQLDARWANAAQRSLSTSCCGGFGFHHMPAPRVRCECACYSAARM